MIQQKLVDEISVDEISLNFPELFIKGKYVKIRFKNRESPCYFVSSRGQKIKNITKIERKRLFLFTLLVSFFMAFLVQKLTYLINIWFHSVFGSLTTYLFQEFMWKDHLDVHVFQHKNWCNPKSDRWFFF